MMRWNGSFKEFMKITGDAKLLSNIEVYCSSSSGRRDTIRYESGGYWHDGFVVHPESIISFDNRTCRINYSIIREFGMPDSDAEYVSSTIKEVRWSHPFDDYCLAVSFRRGVSSTTYFYSACDIILPDDGLPIGVDRVYDYLLTPLLTNPSIGSALSKLVFGKCKFIEIS